MRVWGFIFLIQTECLLEVGDDELVCICCIRSSYLCIEIRERRHQHHSKVGSICSICIVLAVAQGQTEGGQSPEIVGVSYLHVNPRCCIRIFFFDLRCIVDDFACIQNQFITDVPYKTYRGRVVCFGQVEIIQIGPHPGFRCVHNDKVSAYFRVKYHIVIVQAVQQVHTSDNSRFHALFGFKERFDIAFANLLNLEKMAGRQDCCRHTKGANVYYSFHKIRTGN